MALVRVGRNAFDVDLIARIEDTGGAVAVVFRDRDRLELAGEDAEAVRALVASLPSHLPPAGFGVECADDDAGVRGLAGEFAGGEERR